MGTSLILNTSKIDLYVKSTTDGDGFTFGIFKVLKCPEDMSASELQITIEETIERGLLIAYVDIYDYTHNVFADNYKPVEGKFDGYELAD